MFSYASEICIRKAQSFQRSDFDAEILICAEQAGDANATSKSVIFFD
jgi:hypothetical protein